MRARRAVLMLAIRAVIAERTLRHAIRGRTMRSRWLRALEALVATATGAVLLGCTRLPVIAPMQAQTRLPWGSKPLLARVPVIVAIVLACGVVLVVVQWRRGPGEQGR